ncbi:arylesterase [Azospirillum argentinense]|uniref:SGNH hydrolase-type esterase domain-containing protein n=4 Tax=Azospirillum argentinense TaxID=2970906 RepID=A0A5B0KVJ0_9PROT|nr:arylesterase [Azospirillum argentinense]KAA1055458.1 Arylesterase precursor [Azospirillum argentinense]
MRLWNGRGNGRENLTPYGMVRRHFNMALLRSGLAALAVVAGIGAGVGMTAPALAQSGAGKGPYTLLALGDSLTAGYGLPEPQAFTVQLQAALRAKGYDVTVVNAGVSGDTTAGGLSRLDWALADKPDAVLVELGANDMLRGLDPAAARANLDAILKRLTGETLPVLLAGMYASPSLGRAYMDRFNAIYPDLAKTYDVQLYPFFLDGVAADAALNQPDGIHPNAAGVKVIVERITPHVARLLDGIAKSGD